MKESIKKKFDSIDQSKIKVESTKELLAKIEKALNGKIEENADKAEALLDKFIAQAKAKNADIFVSKKAEPTLTATEKKKATQVVKSKLETLMDTIANDPLLKDFNNSRRSKGGGKSDPLIDSERKAIQSGPRVSKKGWKNQYGKSTGGRKYYEYRENRIDRKAPNYGDRPWLKEGGFIHPSDANADKYVVVEIKADGSRREHNNFGDVETARMFASLKREFLPKGSQLMIEDKNGKNLYRSFKSGGMMAEQDYEKGFENEKTHLDAEDFAKISARVDKEYLAKDRKSGVHDKFTKYWYNGGREKAIAKYGEDERKAWEESYEDFKEDFYKMAKGGRVDESTAMVLSQNKAIAHHTEELKKAIAKNKKVEPWVVAKIERASTDISDVTHYLDGKTEYAKGGKIDNQYEGRSDSDIWNSWTKEQKYHFLDDHNDEFPQIGRNEKKILQNVEYNNILNADIEDSLKRHIRQGQYAKGGNISTWDNAVYRYLEGKSILIYSMGVKTPLDVKITSVIPPDPKFSIPTLVLKTGNTEERIEGKEKIENLMNGKQVELYDGKEYYAIELAPMSKSKKPTGDYVKRKDIKLIFIKNPNKNGSKNYLMIDKTDFLDGLHKMSGGGKLSDDYTYIKRNDVMEVVYKDNNGPKENSNPKNGFWVSKKALIDAGMNATQKPTKKLDFGTTSLRKGSSGWIAKNKVDDYKGYDWEITTMKSMRGDLVSTAVGGKTKRHQGYSTFEYVMYQDPNIRLITSKPARITEKVISEQQQKALQEFESKVNEKYAKGGEIQVAVGDKVKSKSGVEGIVYESMGTMFKLEDKYGNKSPKYHSSKNFKPSEIKKGEKFAKGGSISDGSKLPEDMSRYFIKTSKTRVVEMSDLKPLRARPTGIENAEKYMRMAYEGTMDKRKPITIYKSQGKYRVYDGNSTYAVAKANGWEKIWAEIVKNPNMNTYEKRGNDLFIRAKKIRKEGEAWKDAIQRAKAMK